MANTYTKMYVQLVFAVQNRTALIPKQHKEEIHKFIAGVISKRGQKLLAINSMPDHIHIFIGIKPTIRVSDLVRDIKTTSSTFIRDKKFTPFLFKWQNGYGAFTYGHSQVDTVCNYIKNQEKHHKKRTFKEEYLAFLEKFDVEFEEKYLFDWI